MGGCFSVEPDGPNLHYIRDGQPLVVSRMMASVGSWMEGSGTSSTWTWREPYAISALTSFPGS